MAYLLVAEWTFWQIPVIVFFTHFLIDMVKSFFSYESILVFVVDQLAHLLVMVGLWYWLLGETTAVSTLLYIIEEKFRDSHVWIVVASYLLVMKPTSILLSLFIRQWTPKNNDQNSLPNAGKWIGYLERVLILTMIYLGCLEGIGFLLAAKSIFRFGELTKPREVKITEYVMIGTLSSFTVAILLGAVANLLFD